MQPNCGVRTPVLKNCCSQATLSSSSLAIDYHPSNTHTSLSRFTRDFPSSLCITSLTCRMAKEPLFDRKAFEFRKLLGKISDGLGVENVRALKNLCYDFLPERKREEINTGIELFNVLIEQNRIKFDHTAFLCELLDEIGRKDLTEEVKKYLDKTENPVQPSSVYIQELDFRILKLISQEVGREWKMLARHLGLDEATVQGIHQANFGDLHEASLQSLQKWQKINGVKATPKALKAALCEMRLMSIVDKYFEGV